MLPRAQEVHEIPEETARISRAAFPKGSAYMRLRDELGSIYSSQQFAHLFPSDLCVAYVDAKTTLP